jgi:hypothetical protein
LIKFALILLFLVLYLAYTITTVYASDDEAMNLPEENLEDESSKRKRGEDSEEESFAKRQKESNDDIDKDSPSSSSSSSSSSSEYHSDGDKSEKDIRNDENKSKDNDDDKGSDASSYVNERSEDEHTFGEFDFENRSDQWLVDHSRGALSNARDAQEKGDTEEYEEWMLEKRMADEELERRRNG